MLSAHIEVSQKAEHIIKTKDLAVIRNPRGLGYELFENLKKHGANIAQIDIETGESQTYTELLEKCVITAIRLKEEGVNAGDIVASCSTNHFNTIVALIAPILIGAKTTSISPLHSVDDTREMIKTISPKLIFVCNGTEEKISDATKDLEFSLQIITFGTSERYSTFENFARPLENIEEFENFKPYETEQLTEIIALIFSSGKSGVPKAKCFDHYSILSQTARLAKSRGRNANSLVYSGLDWIDTHVNLITNIKSGNTWYITSEYQPDKLEEQLNNYEITHLTLSVFDSLKLLRHWKPNKIKAPKLKTITIFAKKLSAEIINEIQKIFFHPIQINNTYNLSEIYGPCFALNSNKLDSVGVPTEGFWYKVTDTITNKPCAPYKKGEICIKSKFAMTHCYDEDFASYFDEDGFLKTGDLGYYDDEHNFFTIDPLNEILTFNTHISTTALAQILYQHPAVKIAGIFGVPSKDGDIVTGVVVKSEKYPYISEAELIKFVNDKVEDFEKISGGIMFVDEHLVPFTPTGKVKRFLLQKAIFEDFDNLDISINFA